MQADSALGGSRKALEALAPDGEAGQWSEVQVQGLRVPCWERAFWTARQRQAHSLHEISYRACYKPQLPRCFIEALTAPDDRVLDPFGGRGTTGLEAALLGRRVASNDANPLCALLLAPRLDPPDPEAVAERLGAIPWRTTERDGLDLSMFYHPDTEGALRALRAWFLAREASGDLDVVDAWIRMVATNRLTGHSPGFFSVYTLPPNQATSPKSQQAINAKRNQTPPFRDVPSLILRKTRQLLKDLTAEDRARLRETGATAHLSTGDAANLQGIPEASVALTVTSPPFLDVVQYAADNWLRCWFNGLDADALGTRLTVPGSLGAWTQAMGGVFRELARVTRSGGHVAFEVGEVRKGTIRLEETILPLGLAVGFEPLGVLVNRQVFTKTAHIWGVDNNARGTNSNRIALFRKP